MTNSNQKGKRGEREAAAYLRSLGFESARRTQQYNGDGKSDVVCDELPGVHIEVKFGYPAEKFFVGSKAMQDACSQAKRDASGKSWCVLWRNQRRSFWCLTFLYPGSHTELCTVHTSDAITHWLRVLVVFSDEQPYHG